MDPGPAVGADRGQIAEARPVLLDESADPVGEAGLVGGEFGPGSHAGILSNKCTNERTRHAGHRHGPARSERAMVVRCCSPTATWSPRSRPARCAWSRSSPALVQPSSIDVRLDRLFRVFNNHLYTHIDPAMQQDDLTSAVEVPDGEPFVLHPGEFVLASTLEVISLGDQLAGRLEGKSSPGPARAAHALDRRLHRPGLLRSRDAGTVQRGEPADHPLAGHEDRAALHLPALLAGRAPVRLGGLRLALPGPAGADPSRVLAALAHLADPLSARPREPQTTRARRDAIATGPSVTKGQPGRP